MGWTTLHDADAGLVRVTSEGPLVRADLRALTREAAALGQQVGCARFLIDHRRMTLEVGIVELFDMPQRGDGRGFGPDLRIALLIEADSPARPDFEFYVIQCGNRGIHFVRLFFDVDAAIDWLGADRLPLGNG